MTKTVPITTFRQNLPKIVDNADKKMDEYIITVNGVPKAILMSVAEFESWQETNEILSDPELMKSIRQGEKDIAEGRVHDWEDVKKELGWK
ncbi:MAG: type II toxin-antitoxin system Phd/YefM family antitoxin [Candidatus Levybacteria bacterium]|nr:type II toxin-antitoxin system Phd/YefM family antitoxin [Candidatus Levybacteria bacterium]